MSSKRKDNELIREMMRVLNVDELRARFILAIERGETAGDAIEVDEDGNEILPEPKG